MGSLLASLAVALPTATLEGAPVSQRLVIESSAYSDNGGIPARFTCDGQDISPPLAWSGAPAGTKSFVLIIEDPDAPDPAAPKMTWVHWVLYDIPAGVHFLPESASRHLPDGTREGVNGWQQTGFRGPCPPIGRHRYFHKLYALDVVLPDLHAPDKARLEAAMRGHVLAQAQFIGTYRHPG
ncbi:MAG: YbhB/YbcL family Raf kinase inhibitor-like protein [Gammaproteobacteria bacterium]|nr:YbhB/YbcL family Raf kinase inhibitor-like protein [Gammaproteobacteria bacterium]MDE2346790.1 YbhB/YbcL family Raf kinase inhibitor-like protein [Gammaproteobacteria bacterium]